MHTRHSFGRFNRWIVIGAVVLRLATEPAITQPIGQALTRLRTQPLFARAMLYLEFGCSSQYPAVTPEPGQITVKKPAEEAPTQAAQGTVAAPTQTSQPLTFTEADSEGIHIVSTCSYTVDKAELLNRPLAGDFSGDGPKILIVHTHASEAYTPESADDYDPSGDYHTMDTDYNVVRVGTEMAQVFEAHGISVIHDTSINDAAGYSDAYDRMADTIAGYLEEYPSIQMVLDVHRDAYEGVDGQPGGNVVTVDGEESAQVMLVMGTDESGQYHPNWQDNLSCALKTQAVLQRDYPELCRDLVLRRIRYNQNQTPCSMLVEVGASGNTLSQALVAARHFARAVCQVIESET